MIGVEIHTETNLVYSLITAATPRWSEKTVSDRSKFIMMMEEIMLKMLSKGSSEHFFLCISEQRACAPFILETKRLVLMKAEERAKFQFRKMSLKPFAPNGFGILITCWEVSKVSSFVFGLKVLS